MTRDEYETVQGQLLVIGALVRSLDLDSFIAAAEHSEAIGPLLAPSHWIAGQEKLALILTLARKLRAFQAALPSKAEALRLDIHADDLRRRLGV